MYNSITLRFPQKHFFQSDMVKNTELGSKYRTDVKVRLVLFGAVKGRNIKGGGAK